MQNQEVIKDTVIYTRKSNEDPLGPHYYIVKNIVFGYNPNAELEDTVEGKEFWKRSGKDYYITEAQKVNIRGEPIGESFGHIETVERFLSRYKVWMAFPTRKKIRSRKVMP